MRPLIFERDGEEAGPEAKVLLTTKGACEWTSYLDMANVMWVGLKPLAIEDVPPSVRYVVCPATGTDHLPLMELAARGVQVISLAGNPGLRDVPATAELTIALMLAMQRRLPVAIRSEAHERHPDLFGMDLRGKRVAVIGYGRIGKMVSDLLWAFGARPMGLDIRHGDMQRQMAECLPVADIVTLHVDLNPTSVGLIGAKELAAMKPGAMLVNTSRGAVVDEAALLRDMRRGSTTAALDVTSGSHDEELRKFSADHPDRLLLTPHLGGYTAESTATAERLAVERLLEVYRDA